MTADRIWQKYIHQAVFMPQSAPRKPTTNAGPVFEQKQMSLCASFFEIVLFFSIEQTHFVPTGKPSRQPHKKAIDDWFEVLKTFENMPPKLLPTYCGMGELTISSLSTRKGKRTGTTFKKQSSSALTIAAYACVGALRRKMKK